MISALRLTTLQRMFVIIHIYVLVTFLSNMQNFEFKNLKISDLQKNCWQGHLELLDP